MVMMIIGVMLYYGIYAFLSPTFAEGDPGVTPVVTVLTLEVIRQFTQLVLAVIVPVICFMIAIFRYRLWSADPIINRALVYSAFVGILSLIYFVSVVVIGLFVNTINFVVSIPITLFILLIFQPLRERIQKTVDRLMFGDRGDALAVLSHLDRQVTLADTTDRALAAVAQMLAQTLRVPCVLVAIDDHDQERAVTATYGRSSERLRLARFPMVFGQLQIGQITLYQDMGDRPFTQTERELIEMVTRQTALIVNTIRLNSDLQRSRQNIVNAREEERRRLRRDLHDGLGPTLAAHSLKVGKARTLIPKQPETASAILGGLETDLAASLGEIRRLVESLRPPVLDQLGLAGAIREFISPLSEPGQGAIGTTFTLEYAFAGSDMPAAVEVAAYRIVTEALTNVMRHARASTCEVSIDGRDALELWIRDDGVGLPASAGTRHGVGLNSMRERAEELGGTFQLTPVFSGGTQIFVRLPLS
jgi:signal transduction histidine kinase